jgi:serine protease Do
MTLDVEIGLLPSQEELAQTVNPQEPQKSTSLGLNVRDLTDDERERFEVSSGVLVEGISNGPAAQAGVNVGDIITTVDGKSISSVSQLRDLVGDLPNDRPVALRIVRSGSPIYLALRIE